VLFVVNDVLVKASHLQYLYYTLTASRAPSRTAVVFKGRESGHFKRDFANSHTDFTSSFRREKLLNSMAYAFILAVLYTAGKTIRKSSPRVIFSVFFIDFFFFFFLLNLFRTKLFFHIIIGK
jgi:hypothetical protein